MVSRNDRKYVIWPAYFDKNLSRSEGRKVPENLAVENPSIDRIFEVSKELNLNPIIDRDSRYPSRQWSCRGRILIDMKDKKCVLLRKIAEKLKSSAH